MYGEDSCYRNDAPLPTFAFSVSGKRGGRRKLGVKAGVSRLQPCVWPKQQEVMQGERERERERMSPV